MLWSSCPASLLLLASALDLHYHLCDRAAFKGVSKAWLSLSRRHSMDRTDSETTIVATICPTLPSHMHAVGKVHAVAILPVAMNRQLREASFQTPGVLGAQRLRWTWPGGSRTCAAPTHSTRAKPWRTPDNVQVC